VPLGAWPREVCVAAHTLSSDAAFTNASNTLNDWTALQLASKHEKRPVGHDFCVHFFSEQPHDCSFVQYENSEEIISLRQRFEPFL